MKDTRKKSRDLKILSGNAGKRKLKPEPKFPPASKKCPYPLDKFGRREWNRIFDELRLSGVLTKIDETILWAYCTQLSIAMQCSQKIQEEGLLVKATPKSKRLTVNPHLQILNQSLMLMNSFAKELGITPASRSRVTVKPIRSDDPYIKRKAERQARVDKIKEGIKDREKKKKDDE